MVEVILFVLIVVLCVMFLWTRKKYLDERELTDTLEAANQELETKLAASEQTSEQRKHISESFCAQLNDTQTELVLKSEELEKAEKEIALLKSKLTRKPKNKVANPSKTEKK